MTKLIFPCVLFILMLPKVFLGQKNDLQSESSNILVIEDLKIPSIKNHLYLSMLSEADLDTTSTDLAAPPEKFVIKKPFKQSTFREKEIRNMEQGELREILKQDAKAYKTFQSGKVMSVCGFLALIGSIGLSSASYDPTSPGSQVDSDLVIGSVALGVSAFAFSIGGSIIQHNAIKDFELK